MFDNQDQSDVLGSGAKKISLYASHADTITFNITHAEPLVPARFFDHAIALGNFGEELPMHISKLNSFWHLARSVAYQAAGSYSVPYAVKQLGITPNIIGLTSYRKVISKLIIGDIASNAPHMRQVTIEELASVPVELTRPVLGHEFLVPSPIYLEVGIVSQYVATHLAVDLFDYIGLAAELGILSTADVTAFSLQQHLIPGGCELGYYPASWLLPLLEKLEGLGRAFLIKHERRLRTYDNYQIRALSFLSERLGSFFLIRKLTEVYGPQLHISAFGFMCTIVNSGRYAHAVVDGAG